ncbi:hypothetical protein ACN469_16990 [Corallococcus terminator]
MSQIDRVLAKVHPRYFTHLSGASYVRIMDTPRIWGQPFGPGIMPAARKRTKDFERALGEIIQKSRYRCDVSSLNSPDPAWAKVILGAMDASLSAKLGRTHRTQFRFLFGQTPMIFQQGTSPNLIDFQGALIRLVRARARYWEQPPEIWMGKFYRLQEGLVAGLSARVTSSLPSWLVSDGDDDFTKMTWNHSKIIAVDGAEALVGGHNLNMDLFTSYPPVHDVSVVMHGEAALGAQQYLNKMWECKTDVLTKEHLDAGTLKWSNVADDDARVRLPEDPLLQQEARDYRTACFQGFARLHEASGSEARPRQPRPAMELMERIEEEAADAEAIRREDLQTFADLEAPVFKEKEYNTYAALGEYKKSTRALSIGKYWKGSSMELDYEKASELMKEELIKGARSILRLSQMDLVSAWKKKWSSHVVCHWIMEALLANPKLEVQVVVSPLDAGAGAEGDQYSFGSGACRTFELFQYYMAHAVDTDARLPDADVRLLALDRLHIAPFYFTDVPKEKTREGDTYFWPELTPEGYTATLKQPPLAQLPPSKGVIGSALESVKKASGAVFPKVPSAPGNHSKIMIVDDESYVVGSDNLYPGFLSEFNYLVEGSAAVGDMLRSYWVPLWHYSGQHCVNPRCVGGCTTRLEKARPVSLPGLESGRIASLGLSRKVGSAGLGGQKAPLDLLGGRKDLLFPSALGPSMSFRGAAPFRSASSGLGLGLAAQGFSPPLLNLANRGKVSRVDLRAPADLGAMLRLHEESMKKAADARRLASPVVVVPTASATSSSVAPKTSATSSSGATVQARSPSSEPDSSGDQLGGTHYYTNDQIHRLLGHYLGRTPNVSVHMGISRYEVTQMFPGAYGDVLGDMRADSPPRVLLQPYNVGGNHWALMYIKVAPPTGAGRGQARVLYIDPLAPMGADLSLFNSLGRAFPDLLFERCLVRYQDDKFGGGGDVQHSCGAWVVQLARQLVQSDGALPPADANPRTAAVRLRAEHQRDLDGLNRHADDFVVVENPFAESGAAEPRPKASPPTATSGGSVAPTRSLDKVKEEDDDDDFVVVDKLDFSQF